MIHLIYIYFIINAFLAGMFAQDNWKYSLLAFFFGCLYPIVWVSIRLIEITEIRTLFDLYFTKNFANFNDSQIENMKSYHKHQVSNNRWFRVWIMKLVDKKYNYGITKEVK